MKKLSKRQKKWIERTVRNDRSYKAVLYNRFFMFLVFAILQAVAGAILLWSFAYNSTISIVLQTLTGILALVFVVHLLNADQNPSMRTSWIIVILILPIFGVPMYLLNGRGVATRKMGKRLQDARQAIDKIDQEQPLLVGGVDVATRCGGFPAYADGAVIYYDSGEKAFPEMIRCLKGAERFILLEYFIITHGQIWGEILKILLKKAEQGVKIRIIYDDFGCIVTLPPRYEKYLESLHENIRCISFNKVAPFFSARMNNRDHRKMLIVDGKTAFTGGINLADEYANIKKRFGYWKDNAVKVTGNGVRSFTKAFFVIWNAFCEDKESVETYLLPLRNEDRDTLQRIQPYDDSPLDKLPIAETVYAEVIRKANSYVWIFTPYLVLDDRMREILCSTAMRGVDVRIVTPAVPDKKTTYRLTRANYGVLLQAGVKIYEYTPGFIHAKSIVADDNFAVVGTVNFDYRSFYHHFENAVYFSHCKAVRDLKKDCEETFIISKERTKENYKRSVIGRMFDAILRAFEILF